MYNSFYGSLRKNVVNPINDTKTINNVWIFHHTDADGYCSGAITYSALKNKLNKLALEIPESNWHLIASDYNTKFVDFDIIENDIVAFVDLSFTLNTIWQLENIYDVTSNIIWIDHHESDIDVLNKNEEIDSITDEFTYCVIGGRANKYSAALMCWAVFHDKEIEFAPEYVKLVSDWDTWTHELENSIYFNQYVNGVENYRLVSKDENNNLIIDVNSIWFKLENESNNLDESTLNKTPLLNLAIKTGKPIVEDQRIKNQRYLRSNGFETTLLGYNVLACNQKSNSLLFGDKYNDYDIVCPFVLHERNGKLIYTYSLFSSNKDVNCRKIAEQFGGGGHKGAAGFSTKINIFTCSKLRLKWEIFKNTKFKNKSTNK